MLKLGPGARARFKKLSLQALACLAVFVAVFLAMPSGRHGARLMLDRFLFYFRSYPAMVNAAQTRLNASLGSNTVFPLSQPRVVIHKQARRADLFSGDQLIKTYPVVLGGQSIGDKQRKGDQKTPEGRHYICTRLKRSTYHLFMGLNYPTSEDAERGYRTQLISDPQRANIIEAERNHNAPDWTTQLGGAIGMHGGGTHADWTDGCIAFNNQDVEEIWAATDYWTPVDIEP